MYQAIKEQNDTAQRLNDESQKVIDEMSKDALLLKNQRTDL